MRILAIGTNFTTLQSCRPLKYISQPNIAIQQTDSVTFKRSAGNAEEMRELFKYGMIDIHTGQYVIDPELFDKFKKEKLFSGSLRKIIDTIKPLQNTLHEVESELFDMLEKCADKCPDITLSEIFKILSVQANKDLLKKQEPIFKKLEQEAKQLPSEQLVAFNELMQRTKNQLECKPVPYKFSKNDMKYKLSKISKKIERSGNKEEVKAIRHVLNMVYRLPYTPSGRNFSNRGKIDPKLQKRQIQQIRQINTFINRSALCDNKELQFVLIMIKQELFDIPVIVPFSRKTFLHELETILDTVDNKKYAHYLAQIAKRLPTSNQDVSAFIVKHSRSSSEDIGHSLLVGQVGAIDHIDAFSLGGEDCVENYAFTSSAYNSMRGNTPMNKWLIKNPKTYAGAQKSVDRIIEVANSGKTGKEKFMKHYVYSFAKKMQNVSPKDKPLIINTQGFRY